jgi:hypothetical protein
VIDYTPDFALYTSLQCMRTSHNHLTARGQYNPVKFF